MKRYLSFILLLLFLSFGRIFAFSDIENNWYKNSIIELKKRNIIQGFDDGTFKPHNKLTRAELLKILLLSGDHEIQEEWSESCFNDIDVSKWYAKYVCTAYEQGYAKGYEDGTFAPQKSLTVLEALVFGIRLYDLDVRESRDGEEWYERYQEFADSVDLIPNFRYTLDTQITRGQAAQLLYRLYLYSQEESFDSLSNGCQRETHIPVGEHNLMVQGEKRNYLLYIPDDIARDNPKGIIIAFHGRTNNNHMVRDYMGLGGGKWKQGQNDYVVAYPAGLGIGPFTWHQESNIEFFDTLLNTLSEKLCINKDKVFVVGHSLGSYMANRVSCRRGDVVRAMAGVASSGNTQKDCRGAVASLTLHLPEDNLSPYKDGTHAYSKRSTQNMCESEETPITLPGIGQCSQKKDCSLGSTSIFCDSYSTYGDQPHSWPENGADGILEFFRNVEKYSE